MIQNTQSLSLVTGQVSACLFGLFYSNPVCNHSLNTLAGMRYLQFCQISNAHESFIANGFNSILTEITIKT
jgi:hypothetical protein